MKRALVYAMVCAVSAGIFGIACKKVSMKDLQYLNVTTNNCYQAYVQKKNGDIVLWFQVFDNIDEKDVLNSYKTSKDRIDKYPAKIYKDKWIWLLVNNRMEIRLLADNKAKDFQNTDELTRFIKKFDLAAMEQVTGPKMKPEDMAKFIPKLGE